MTEEKKTTKKTVPAKKEEQKKQLNLVQKLAKIMSQVDRIPKNGFNNFHKYNYATESDVTDAVRKHMAEENVIMFPDITDHQMTPVTTARGNQEFLTTIRITYTLMDGDSGEELSFNTIGQGQDAGDKGIYKAITGAQKYALMKLFHIPTGDDPERDDTPDRADAAPAPRATKQKQTQSKKEKAEEDRIFFEARDALEERIKQYAQSKGSDAAKVKAYLIDKANEHQGKNYKSINSINLPVANNVLEQLEGMQKKTTKPDTRGQWPTDSPGAQKQTEMLDRFTNQPQ